MFIKPKEQFKILKSTSLPFPYIFSSSAPITEQIHLAAGATATAKDWTWTWTHVSGEFTATTQEPAEDLAIHCVIAPCPRKMQRHRPLEPSAARFKLPKLCASIILVVACHIRCLGKIHLQD